MFLSVAAEKGAGVQEEWGGGVRSGGWLSQAAGTSLGYQVD